MKKARSHPNFIGLEGCDGAGKTTLRQRIARELRRTAPDMIEIGQHSWRDVEAARVILGVREQRMRYAPEVIEAAYRQDKRLHELYNVRPMLDRGIVLADRTIVSDAVYQEALYGMDAAAAIRRYINEGFLFPGTLIYVFVDIETAVARIAQRGKHRRHYEREVDLRRISDIYMKTLPICEDLTGMRVVRFENETGRMEALFQALLHPVLDEISQTADYMEIV
ncbi:MAG: AAA family ATPase [Paracoccus sp. (in: a-proteobacteria)]|nr:AAA family ATPase [Paracoccus sp. (in: a-proteobacteria)]